MLNRDLKLRTLESSVPTLREYENPFYAMQCEMDRMMDEFLGGTMFPRLREDASDTFQPKINIKETDKEIVVSAELPGIDEKDVEVLLSDDCLTIKGEKKFEKEEKDDGYRRVERRYGSFRRDITLDTDVDTDKVEANFEKGILKVKLMKNETKSGTKKIPIKS